MIGLRRGDVRLFEHNKEWKIEGERTVNELRKILGSDAVDIQHVGSTSIKSIKAKPIIDIAVGTDDFNRILSFTWAARLAAFLLLMRSRPSATIA